MKRLSLTAFLVNRCFSFHLSINFHMRFRNIESLIFCLLYTSQIWLSAIGTSCILKNNMTKVFHTRLVFWFAWTFLQLTAFILLYSVILAFLICRWVQVHIQAHAHPSDCRTTTRWIEALISRVDYPTFFVKNEVKASKYCMSCHLLAI